MYQWRIKLIINIALLCLTDAGPTPNEITSNFRNIIQNQNLETVILSIDERLRNLDQIYSTQLSITIQDKFEQYQRKLEAIDMKIIHLESLVSFNLDKLSENISMKNFKDDISKANFFKKIDGIYESLGQRLNYLDRKFDTQTIKIQTKLDSVSNHLKQIEEGMIQRDEDIESELSDAIAAIDDLKTNTNLMEENIINTTQENYEIALKNQKSLLETHLNSSLMFQMLIEKNTENFEEINEKLITQFDIINDTGILIKGMRNELKNELNEYAIKVSDMNADNWKTDQLLQQQQINLEKIINTTKIDIQNGIRALIVLIGKNYNKNLTNKDKTQLEMLNDKLDANFEKIFSAQNLFLDSCYRLQMDESQIESKISDILEKLMETFDKKTAVELKDVKNLEKTIKNHDVHIMRNLYQIGTNIITVYEKLMKDNQKFDMDLSRANENLNALFTLLQNILINGNDGSPMNASPINLKTINGKLEALIKNNDELIGEIKRISINDVNLNRTLSRIESRIQQLPINNNTIEIFDKINATNNGELETNSTNLDDLIKQVFGSGFNKNPINNTIEGNRTKCRQNYFNLIDVRMNGGNNNESNEDCPPQEEIEQISTTTIKPQIHQSLPTTAQEYDEIKSIIDQIIMVDNKLGGNGIENGTTLEIMRVN